MVPPMVPPHLAAALPPRHGLREAAQLRSHLGRRKRKILGFFGVNNQKMNGFSSINIGDYNCRSWGKPTF